MATDKKASFIGSLSGQIGNGTAKEIRANRMAEENGVGEMFDPPHPGELLQEYTEHRYIFPNDLHPVVECQEPITTENVERIVEIAGKSPGFWLRIQASYDRFQERLKTERFSSPINPHESA